jgi:hypothetical protein
MEYSMRIGVKWKIGIYRRWARDFKVGLRVFGDQQLAILLFSPTLMTPLAASGSTICMPEIVIIHELNIYH